MNETFAAELTGPGRAAVATIGICGPEASSMVMSRFVPANQRVGTLVMHRIYFGRWCWQGYEEELVLCRVGENQLEIHCHGGHLASDSILASLKDIGAVVVSADEWVDRHTPDRFVRDALRLLPQLKTSRVVAIALDQTRSTMQRALLSIQAQVAENQWTPAISELREILKFGALGTRLAEPFRVALIGPPNSGKSSLINALLGYDRSIVCDQPGTTRDLVSAETAFDGWPVLLTDTAGIRATDDAIEQAGIELATNVGARADLMLLICDMTNPQQTEVLPMAISSEVKLLRVGTKCDIGSAGIDLDIETSALQSIGVEALGQRLVDDLVPHPPPQGSAVPLSSWQVDRLNEMLLPLERQEAAEADRILSELLRQTEFKRT